MFKQWCGQEKYPRWQDGARLSKLFANATWIKEVSDRWKALPFAEKIKWGAKPKTFNKTFKTLQNPQQPRVSTRAELEGGGRKFRSPWQMGDERLPITVDELTDFQKERHQSYIGDGCMICSDDSLADLINRKVLVLGDTTMCWQRGFCRHDSLLRGVGHGTFLETHQRLQTFLLKDVGIEACCSGDVLLYFQGTCANELGADAASSSSTPHFRGSFEVFALIAKQSLWPRRSIFSILAAPGRNARTWDAEIAPMRNVHYIDQDGMDCGLPPELHILEDGNWDFVLSTSFCVHVLEQTKKHILKWSVATLDYTHKTQNILKVGSSHVLGMLVKSNLDAPSDLLALEDQDDVDGVGAAECEFVDAEADAEAVAFDGLVEELKEKSDEEEENESELDAGECQPKLLEARGNVLYELGNIIPLGRMSVVVQWFPPSHTMRCLHKDHINCTLTGDCTDDVLDKLKHWIAIAHHHKDSHSHKAAKPQGLRRN